MRGVLRAIWIWAVVFSCNREPVQPAKVDQWFCTWLGPNEPVIIGSCFRSAERCSANLVGGNGSCVISPFAWCVGSGEDSCFFEYKYCEKTRTMLAESIHRHVAAKAGDRCLRR
jgi:hypothetical protein